MLMFKLIVSLALRPHPDSIHSPSPKIRERGTNANALMLRRVSLSILFLPALRPKDASTEGA